MYRYDSIDKTIIQQRVAQFKDQTERYLAGKLSEAEFLPLRLQNGVYIERNAAMLRIAIPYGCITSLQLRKLAQIANKYDQGFGHFTTRQNLQFNWIKLRQVPDILAELANVDMHAMQTSGNCIRSITSDHLAGVAVDEIKDPRVWCELLRQWSALNPEFAYLPRKFKFAINAANDDRAAIKLHDIGLQLRQNQQGQIGFEIWVGGGLGRTPMIASLLHEFLPWQHLRSYVAAILRVYNRYGRRDNKYKARIKILVTALGIDKFKTQVETEFAHNRQAALEITPNELQNIDQHFIAPNYQALPKFDFNLSRQQNTEANFINWQKQNVHPHKVKGYAAVTLSLKEQNQAPGDCSSRQMEAAANLAEKYSFAELRVTHQQNLLLADVRQQDLYDVWQQAKLAGLASANNGLLSDIICCPGAQYCSLSKAQSIPIAKSISQIFSIEEQRNIGAISLNISGCVNACAHHHIGNIGILGLEKQGEACYQILLGGKGGLNAKLAKIIGSSLSAADTTIAIKKIIALYLERRQTNELFIDTLQRLGCEPFKATVYGKEKKENLDA